MNISLSADDYVRISELAYRELLQQKCTSFHVEPRNFFYPSKEITIVSAQEYAKLVHRDCSPYIPEDCRDGYVYRNSQPGRDLILYNADVHTMRMRFTIAHEIGHARLKHKAHTKIEEAEAHLFACQLLAPDVIL
jgi:Predicted Zn peptidase